MRAELFIVEILDQLVLIRVVSWLLFGLGISYPRNHTNEHEQEKALDYGAPFQQRSSYLPVVELPVSHKVACEFLFGDTRSDHFNRNPVLL